MNTTDADLDRIEASIPPTLTFSTSRQSVRVTGLSLVQRFRAEREAWLRDHGASKCGVPISVTLRKR